MTEKEAIYALLPFQRHGNDVLVDIQHIEIEYKGAKGTITGLRIDDGKVTPILASTILDSAKMRELVD